MIEDPTERKIEIDNKLIKEQTNLALLRETVNKSSQLTNGMVTILASFEDRLAKLEETIVPLYQETGNLQRKQDNIEKTIVALDHVISFYNVSKEVEYIIKSGPGGGGTTGGGGLDSFLRAMDQLQKAHDYFEKNNPQSVEVENVRSLCNTGGDALGKEFKDLLVRHSKSVPPVVILDLVDPDNESEMPNEEAPSQNHLPENVRRHLITIAEWLIVHGRDEYMNVYARVRATILLRSLQGLKEHQRSSSGGTGSSLGLSSPGLQRAKFGSRHETPSRRTSKRLQQALEKKANKMLLKASQTFEQSTGLAFGHRRSGGHHSHEKGEDVVEEQEIGHYLISVNALLRLMQSELTLMMGIIPLQHQKQIFEIIIRESLDLVAKEGESIAARAKRCISRHDFAAVLVVFPVLQQLQAMKPEFEKVLDGCDMTVRSKFAGIVVGLHGTGVKSLEEFIESVRNDPATLLPRDGTVHELTSNVLMFLDQLADFVDTIGGMLAQDPTYQYSISSELFSQDTTERNKALLGSYIRKVLVQLNCTLVSKSDTYSDPFLKAVFRLNNHQYVLRSIQRSGLLELVSKVEPECEQNYNSMIEEHKRMYIQSWGRVLYHIWSADDVPVAVLQAGKLKDKDRQIIKEKFAGFNKEMDEIAKVQRGYSIPDVELRESLKFENKDYILPKYSNFYEKYLNVQFTKNPEKYIRYTPAQVSDLMDTFFDVAA